MQLNPADPYHVVLMQKSAFADDPIALIKAGYLKVKTKDGELLQFRLKKCQKRIIEKIQEKRKLAIPVRGVILKTRQTGISTLCESIIFSFCTQRGVTQGLVMADDEEGASDIFKMNETFYESISKDHPHLTPKKTRSDERRMEFYATKSAIRIETANNRRAGRKYTYRAAHLTEVAFYPRFKELMAGLLPSIPDRPETVLLLETTANGLGEFHQFWQEKRKLEAAGRTEWFTIFIPWKEDEDCFRNFVHPKEREGFLSSMSVEEQQMQKEHSLTLEQMNWRRHTLEDVYNNDVNKFNVEYPLTEKDAFQTTSRRVFPDRLTQPQEAHLVEPLQRGEIEVVNRRPAFVPDVQGFLRIYKPPQPEWQYLIGADSCESAVSHDEACAQVIARNTWEQVAHLHGHIAPDDFAKRLFALGLWYNAALLAPEVNGPGMVTVQKLTEMFYPNLCRRTKSVITDQGKWEEAEEVGFHTNVKTKPLIIDKLAGSLRDLLLVLHDRSTLNQLETFVVKKITEEGHMTTGSEEGFYDDCVMSLAIAVWYAHQTPIYKGTREVAPPRFMTGRTGYG